MGEEVRLVCSARVVPHPDKVTPWLHTDEVTQPSLSAYHGKEVCRLHGAAYQQGQFAGPAI